MSTPATTVAPHRATILVGFGTFGRAVLRRLLASAAPRGVLAWEDPRGGAAPRDRHLRDLALLWVPERAEPAGAQEDTERMQEGNALEMMRDLYRQIQSVDGDDTLDLAFAKRLAATAETLLAASARVGRSNALPLGLDVIVLARPGSRDVIGTMDRLLIRGMDLLANNQNLQRAVQGAQALNYISIFDFENYWDHSPYGDGIRKAVHGSIEQWEKRRRSNKPSFGRFYFVDGRTHDGFREAFDRIDEISLFLEFLLFEGQRDGDLQRLYQPLGQFEETVATFGVRLMERSAGLLTHLAAARFGIGWLDHLSSSAPFPGAERSRLREQIELYEAEALEKLLEIPRLREQVVSGLATLEEELLRLPAGSVDWPEEVRSRCEEMATRIEAGIADAAQTQMAKITSGPLARLGETLRAGIDGDLHDQRHPRPVGWVLAEIDDGLKRLDRPPAAAANPADHSRSFLSNLNTLHEQYAGFRRALVRVESLKWFWPLLGVALATGLSPLVHQALVDIPKPSSLGFLADQAYAVVQWVNQPAVLVTLLFLLSWAIGALAFQSRVAARVLRARRYYSDSERGRFVDRIRGGIAPGGALRDFVEGKVDRVFHETTLSVRGVVSRELGRVHERLSERRREMLWLRDQMRGFLRIYGITGEDLQPDAGRLVREGTGVRHSVERGEDLEAVLRENPIGPDRFRSVQANQTPFAGWHEQYSAAFLAPLDFLDRLSGIYADPFQQELARPGMGPQQRRLTAEMREFLSEQGSFGLAFSFPAQDGLPPERTYCLLPSLWRGLPGIMPALADLAIGEASVLPAVGDTGRAYLLRLQTGIEPRCLLEQS
ncbi:MAG TPA: hypothetical protein VHW00_19990 [Thermoanaerobaculia bacterium]|nr:hypothetical protein [Thermoanaerobaculia bacterium]